MAKTTEQLEHALDAIDAIGVELRAAEVVGEGQEGTAASHREVERVRTEVSEHQRHPHERLCGAHDTDLRVAQV